MWTVGDIKHKAWNGVKKYYWPAFGVILLSIILGGANFSVSVTSEDWSKWGKVLHLPPALIHFLTVTLVSLFFFFFVAATLLKIFVGNPIFVGKCRYFMESRGLEESAGVDKVFWVFKSGYYLNVVKIMFFRDLYNSLWYLLLIIPGVIKYYEYLMIPYILSENPDADMRDVFALTKEMTNDEKGHLFVLQLSFTGWILLGFILCVVGIFFVQPYIEAANAEVYAVLRKRIDGFPLKGFGVAEQQDIYEREW